MRVLYVVYNDILSNVFESQLEPLWTALTRKEKIALDVLAYVTPRVLFPSLLRKRWKAVVNASKVHLEPSYCATGYPPRYEGALLKDMKKRLDSQTYSAVHARGPVAAYIAAKALKDRGPKRPRLIFDVRGDSVSEMEAGSFAENGGNETRVLENAHRLREMERFAVEQADALLCVSKPLQEFVRREYGSTTFTSVIPCWAEERPTGARVRSREEVRKDLRINTQDWVWAYAGSYAKWQAIEEMAKLFRDLLQDSPNQKLIVISRDDDAMRGALDRAEVPSEAFRIVSGNRVQVSEYLSAADAAILLRAQNPINRVACPMKFADYVRAGLAVLSSHRIGDVSDWIEKYSVGACAKSLEPSEVLRCARELMRSVGGASRENLSHRTAELFSEKLSLESYLPKYMEVYKGASG